MSTFNRVTTTRKQVAPAPRKPRAARVGEASRRRAHRRGKAAKQQAANSAIPAESTWRQTQRPAPPPATTVKSVTRSYYPGMRPGAHPNADVGANARSKRSRFYAGRNGDGRVEAAAGATSVPSRADRRHGPRPRTGGCTAASIRAAVSFGKRPQTPTVRDGNATTTAKAG